MTLSCEHDMNRREFIIASAVAGLTRRFAASPIGSRIDRVALVKRHCPVLSEANINSSLQVGNGEFAFAADITGLQTFAEEYLKGMPLGTLSDWGWHSFPNPRTTASTKSWGRMIRTAAKCPMPNLAPWP